MTRIVHAASIVALSAVVLAGAPLRADTPEPVNPRLMPETTRVIHLQGMDSREAMTLLRSLHVRCLAQVRSDAVVISDVADKIDQAETLLRERKAVLRVADPHSPMVIESFHSTRVFDVEPGTIDTVVSVLRVIYHARDVQKSEAENRVTFRAAEPILDASEATLRELGLLALATDGNSSND